MPSVNNGTGPAWFRTGGQPNYTPTDKILHPAAFISIDPQCPAAQYWQQQTTLQFQYMDSDVIGDTVIADWQEIPVLGRSESYQSYAGTSNREIPVSLIFLANSDVQGQGYTYNDVQQAVNWIRATQYPYYVSATRSVPPPTVILSFGELFNAVRGLVINVGVQWEAPFELPNGSLLPMAAKVNFQFRASNTTPLGINDVLQGAVVTQPPLSGLSTPSTVVGGPVI